MGFSVISFIGNVGGDPEINTYNDGFKVLRFSVAVNDDKKKPDGTWEKNVSWYPCSIMGKLAETMVGILKKGSPVAISGKPKQYTKAFADGKAQITTVDVSTIQILKFEKTETDTLYDSEIPQKPELDIASDDEKPF